MSDLTPETLGALGDGSILWATVATTDLDAHASAWAADRGDKALAIAALAICREQRNREEDRAIAAEARIKALEIERAEWEAAEWSRLTALRSEDER